MSLAKIHKISTLLAVYSVVISTALIFLAMVDKICGLNLFPQLWESMVMLIAWIFIMMAMGSVLISAVLSLYRLVEKD